MLGNDFTIHVDFHFPVSNLVKLFVYNLSDHVACNIRVHYRLNVRRSQKVICSVKCFHSLQKMTFYNKTVDGKKVFQHPQLVAFTFQVSERG